MLGTQLNPSPISDKPPFSIFVGPVSKDPDTERRTIIDRGKLLLDSTLISLLGNNYYYYVYRCVFAYAANMPPDRGEPRGLIIVITVISILSNQSAAKFIKDVM